MQEAVSRNQLDSRMICPAGQKGTKHAGKGALADSNAPSQRDNVGRTAYRPTEKTCMSLRAAEKWRFNRRVSGKYTSATSSDVIGSFKPRSTERSASERVSGVLERNAAQSLRPKVMYADSSSECVILIRSRWARCSPTIQPLAAHCKAVWWSRLGVKRVAMRTSAFGPLLPVDEEPTVEECLEETLE
jgi:hypothetical protein